LNALSRALPGPIATLVLAVAAFTTWVALYKTPTPPDTADEYPAQVWPQSSGDLVYELDLCDDPEPVPTAREGKLAAQ
jgi:hypothetical protein